MSVYLPMLTGRTSESNNKNSNRNLFSERSTSMVYKKNVNYKFVEILIPGHGPPIRFQCL